MSDAEYTELRTDIRRLTEKVDKVLANHGERIASLESQAVSRGEVCAAKASEISALQERDREQDRAILKVSLISSGFVGAILLFAKPLVERWLNG